MTDEHTAFLRAIVEHPCDLLARLVFADFLEETGDPNHVARAHLIRTQIALEDPTTDPDEYDRLQAFEARLLDLFQDTWDRALPYWVIEEGTVEYRRGFVEHVELPFYRFTRSAGELFAALPLRSLQLRCPAALNADYRGLFDRLPQLAAIESLTLGPNLSSLIDFGPFPRGGDRPSLLFTELMTCRTLSGLRSLSVAGNRITDAWLVAFVSALPTSAFGATLRTLDLSDSHHVTNAGGNTLATARSLYGLKQLILKDVPLNAATRSMLRRSFGDRVTF